MLFVQPHDQANNKETTHFIIYFIIGILWKESICDRSTYVTTV